MIEHANFTQRVKERFVETGTAVFEKSRPFIDALKDKENLRKIYSQSIELSKKYLRLIPQSVTDIAGIELLGQGFVFAGDNILSEKNGWDFRRGIQIVTISHSTLVINRELRKIPILGSSFPTQAASLAFSAILAFRLNEAVDYRNWFGQQPVAQSQII